MGLHKKGSCLAPRDVGRMVRTLAGEVRHLGLSLCFASDLLWNSNKLLRLPVKQGHHPTSQGHTSQWKVCP